MVTSVPIPSYGAWLQKENHWIYEENQIYEKSSWKLIGGAWYYFDDTGYMATGWRLIDGKWYFLNPVSDGTKGKMLIGWQWIDGRCYYLAERSVNNHSEGAMYLSEKSPDGYLVDSSGAWTDENGTVQYVPGKGIQTVIVKKAASSSKFSGGGSGGSGSGSRGSNAEPDKGTMTDRDSKDPAPGEGEAENEPEITELEEPSEGIREPEVEGKQCSYTVRYMDVKDKTILQAIAGVGVEGRTIAIIQPVIDGYELCEGQKESFKLSSDHMVLSIYYERKSVTSPSEARKVDWNLYFVERENHGNEILKTQQGRTEEGKSLIIDFPETILGADRYYYHSLVSSPWSVIVSGNGTQKYFIEFERGDRLPEEADPDQEAKDRLKRWLEIAKDADIRLSGREPSDQQIITTSIEESNDRLLNLVSMTDGTERKEVYLIAKKHVPNTVIISRRFRK